MLLGNVRSGIETSAPRDFPLTERPRTNLWFSGFPSRDVAGGRGKISKIGKITIKKIFVCTTDIPPITYYDHRHIRWTGEHTEKNKTKSKIVSEQKSVDGNSWSNGLLRVCVWGEGETNGNKDIRRAPRSCASIPCPPTITKFPWVFFSVPRSPSRPHRRGQRSHKRPVIVSHNAR